MSDPFSKLSLGPSQVLTHLTNADLAVPIRVAEWQSLLSEMILPVRPEVTGLPLLDETLEEFSGRMRIGQFGPSAWLEIEASAQTLHRGPAEIKASEGPYLFISTMTRGYGWLVADGKRKRIECGQTVFVDSAQPYDLEFDQRFAFVSTMLPRSDLLAYQPHAPGAHACRVPEPVGSALHSFLKALASTGPSPDGSQASPGRRLYDHFVGLALSAIEPIALAAPANPPSSSEVLISHIQGSLLASLARPELNSSWVAERFGLSLRQVQRLFRTRGTTVAKWVLEQRLQRCAEALVDPAMTEQSIGDIAHDWGFNDLSYFSRSFSRRYGCQPKQFRKSEPNGQGPALSRSK